MYIGTRKRKQRLIQREDINVKIASYRDILKEKKTDTLRRETTPLPREQQTTRKSRTVENQTRKEHKKKTDEVQHRSDVVRRLPCRG